jgi:hypothetical protein
VDCGQPKERGKHHMAQRCNPCSKVFYSAMLGAQQVLYRAIRLGQLTKARGLVCADCGGMATDWDHRDYSKPLEVQPVCRSCNFKRGPAKYPRPTPDSERAAA